MAKTSAKAAAATPAADVPVDELPAAAEVQTEPTEPVAVVVDPAIAEEVREDSGLTPAAHFQLFGSFDKLPPTHPRAVAYQRQLAEREEAKLQQEAHEREERDRAAREAAHLAELEAEKTKKQLEVAHAQRYADRIKKLHTEFAVLNPIFLNTSSPYQPDTMALPLKVPITPPLQPSLAILPYEAYVKASCDARFRNGSWACTPQPGMPMNLLAEHAPKVDKRLELATQVRGTISDHVQSKLLRIASMFEAMYVAWETQWNGMDGQRLVFATVGGHFFLLACGDVEWIKTYILTEDGRPAAPVLPIG